MLSQCDRVHAIRFNIIGFTRSIINGLIYAIGEPWLICSWLTENRRHLLLLIAHNNELLMTASSNKWQYHDRLYQTSCLFV